MKAACRNRKWIFKITNTNLKIHSLRRAELHQANKAFYIVLVKSVERQQFSACKLKIFLMVYFQFNAVLFCVLIFCLFSLLCSSSERLVSLIFKDFHNNKIHYFTHNFKNTSFEFKFSAPHPSLVYCILNMSLSECFSMDKDSYKYNYLLSICAWTNTSFLSKTVVFTELEKFILKERHLMPSLVFWRDFFLSGKAKLFWRLFSSIQR